MQLHICERSVLLSSSETWKYDIVSQHLSILKLVSVYNDNIIFRATRDFKEADGQESNVSFNGTATCSKYWLYYANAIENFDIF